MKRRLKVISAVIACALLAAIMINQFSDIITYAVEDNRYLESVEIFSAPTKDEAKKKCIDAGYYFSEGNLNEENGNYVALGYTITDDPEEAITDMSVLEMYNGYQTSDYSTIREYELEKAGFITSAFMKSVSEFRDNLEKGSPAAIEAQKILNIYVIPEMNDMGLGDYLASEKCTEDFLKKIICQANVGVVYAIFNSMACGVADYGEDNWAQRVETSDVKARVASGNENTMLDRSYKDYAYDLYAQLQYFCEQYTKAKQYVDTNGMDSLKKGVEKSSECDISDETMEKIENCEAFDEKETYYLYLQAYDILSQYKYDETTTLAEYIVYLGSLSYKQDADLRNIYPLVDALTQGQIGVFRVSGVVQMAMSLVNNEVILEKTNEYLKEVYDLIKDAYNGKTEHLAIWINTDQTPYNSVIAKTDAEIISTRSGMEFDNLVKENDFDKKLDKAMTLTFVISSAINIASFVVTVGANIAVISKAGVTAWWVGQSVSAWAVCYNAISFATGSILSSILGIMGCAVIIAGYIALIAICVIMLVSFGNWIYNQFKGEDDSLEYNLSDIPKDVYDYRNQAYLHYKAVELNKTGKSADLNAENGRRFAALYYTKNASAGDPIKINPNGNEFMVVSGDTAAPGGYESVRYFGPGAAANLNSYTKNKSAKSLFLSYYKCEATPVNEGEESEIAETSAVGGKYLSSLKVTVQKTETAAKDELKKSGYTPLDVNLSGFYGVENGTYAYLGYQTTDIEKEAITDIRAVPQGIATGESFYFGNIPYYRAGGEDIPATIPSIYFSKSKDAGTPVYPDLQIVNDRGKAKAGFEPINLFCGGDAYNFNATGDTDYDPMSLSYKNWNSSKCIYIYFHPSVTYTSGVEYLGGLAFFTGKNTTAEAGDEIQKYAEFNGFTVCSKNFTEDYSIVFNVKHHVGKGKTTTEETVDDFVTYLAYSKTYNPYRAIYGVKSYTALSDMNALNEMMITGATEAKTESYAACNVFYQFGNEITAKDEKISGFARGIISSNAWNGLNNSSGQNIVPEIESLPEQQTDDFENYGWKTSKPRLKNLYVCGFVPGMSPLRPDDIKVETDLKKEQEYNNAGIYSVQDMKTPNRAEAHNIGISSDNPMYLFVRKDAPVEKPYISSISLASWNLKSYINNDKAFNEMEDEEKEFYEKQKDDLCVISAMQSGTDEVIMRNLAVSYSASKQASAENEPKQAAYLCVSRTDNSSEAIHSIIKYKYKNRSEAEKTIKVEGIEYERVGTEPIYDESFGNYFIYVSKNCGCAPGEPITSISFSDVPLVENCATALTATEKDVTEYSRSGETVKSRAQLKGYADETNYIHSEYESQKTYICDIFIGSGASKKEAMVDLMNMGCNMYLPIDMNKDANGRYVYVGYDRIDVEDYAVRDIICTVGQKPEQEIERDGVTYQRARDRYIMSGDSPKSVSFNDGTNGYSIYLYYSYDADCSPIISLAASERDYVPDNKGAYIWEDILTDSAKRCNFNDGVYASSDGHSIDNRIYLYFNRIDNSTKFGYTIPVGSTKSTMEYGELKLVSK